MDSEKLNAFNENRGEFKPYGLTCELWVPSLMNKPDRHNEIEINYFFKESITYLFQGTRITIPTKSLTIFWGLVPHQIVDYAVPAPYFVCTIPLTQFLEWKLPTHMTDRILKGEVIIENSGAHSPYDEYILNNWIKDHADKGDRQVILLEIQARLLRMAERILPSVPTDRVPIHTSEINQVDQIALYIAQHYHLPIKIADIGRAVGLHPDYTNVIFKKAFGMTISEYITEERISHAQRKLISTDQSITDICFACGFNSISRFNIAFRKINQCTPREYKKFAMKVRDRSEYDG